MTHLDDSFRDMVRAYLARTGISGRRLGAEALGDPGFAASLMRGRRTGLATADRVLAFMGEAPIGPAFRREVEAFLRATRTKAYVLGESAVGDPSFAERLRRGTSLRLATVARVRAWMAAHSDEAGLRAMRRAVAGAALLEAAPDGDSRKQDPASTGGNGMNGHRETEYLSTRKAAAFLGLSPRTMDRNRLRGEGPSYHRFGERILYRREDLVAWADERRVALGGEAGRRTA